jgi:hypothetical protein
MQENAEGLLDFESSFPRSIAGYGAKLESLSNSCPQAQSGRDAHLVSGLETCVIIIPIGLANTLVYSVDGGRASCDTSLLCGYHQRRDRSVATPSQVSRVRNVVGP